MANDIYQHFRPSERLFIDKVTDWIDKVSATYSIVTTDFLNPRECYILQTVLNQAKQQDIHLYSSSMIAETEYVKLIIAPDYYQLSPSDFELSCLQIGFASKFVTLKHSQILGTLLGETGVDRAKIGDITVHPSFAQVFVDQKMVSVFIEKIQKIARSGVKISEIKPEQYVKVPDQLDYKTVSLSSLRLDKVIASIFNYSRSQAQKLIQSNKVKVNYAEVLRNDFELFETDLISIRGFGRVKLLHNLGLTKKNKIRVEVQIISSK